ILHLLFFMPPPPPRSTLFPYTTLFRSLARRAVRLLARHGIRFPLPVSRFPLSVVDGMGQGYGHPSLEGEAARRLAAEHGLTLDRSEEHTSELQSLAYLVCRLLLEKKKK